MKIKKQVSGMMVAILLCGLMVGCSSEPTEEETAPVQQEEVEPVQQEETKVPENSNFVQCEDCSIEITNVFTKKGELGIKYKFNNESDSDISPITAVSFRCYQNGVELESGYKVANFKDQDNILAGYSNEGIIEAKELSDNSKVLIRVEPWISFDDEIFAEFEYDVETDEFTRVK